MEYIELDIQTPRHQKYVTISSSMYVKTYLGCLLERVLKAIQVSSL